MQRNANLHPNSEAGGSSYDDNLKATDSITAAVSVCVSIDSLSRVLERDSEPLSPHSSVS